jgi:hypothetical protein
MRCAQRSLWLNVNQEVLHAHVNQTPAAQVLPPGAASNATSWCNLSPLKAQPKNTNALGSSKGSLCRTTPTLETADASANFAIHYLVKARMKTGRLRRWLTRSRMARSARESSAGDEYLYDMEIARVDAKGDAHWVETCFCDPPLGEERPYREEYSPRASAAPIFFSLG